MTKEAPLDHKTRILLVEDEGLVAVDVQSILRRLGYEVCGVVASGRKAIEKAAEVRPDIVMMDIGLRGNMDGIEAAKYIYDKFKIPIIYITAFCDDITLQKARQTEPLGIIIKPCGEVELYRGIELALSRHKSKSERQSGSCR